MVILRSATVFLALLPPAIASAAPGLVWPTPNPAFAQGHPIEAFVQPSSSGKIESGLFGCSRNGGAKFHEGLDLFPVRRDSQGEALDPVYAILPGKVVHVSRHPGHSSYGRYVVVRHDGESPAFHSLYAHLASVDPAIEVGHKVPSGATLGIMGRSAAGYTIPRSRSHLHLEIGFRLSRDFQTWYDRQKFSSKNRHGNWNGMNLVSIDPLKFYQQMRDGEVKNLSERLKRLPVAARIRVHSATAPDFVRDYPALVSRPYVGKQLVAWDIAFSQYGAPMEWTPRFVGEDITGQAGEIRVLAYNSRLLEAQSCRRVISNDGPAPALTPGTVTTLKKALRLQVGAP